jgi:hypothetical protein
LEKEMTRKLASTGLALSVIWAVISLVVRGGVGVSRADGVVDFNLTSAKAEITHETATTCLNSSFVSCQGIEPVDNETNTTKKCLGPGCLLPGNSFDSDSYEILANLALFNSTEFQEDLNNDIQFALAPGSCAGFAGAGDLSAVPPGTWTGNIPGASLHKVTNKNFTIYNFEGNIPAFTTPPDFIKFFGSSAVFDHLEVNLKIPTNGEPTTMSLEGNANLCAITGPMAFAVYIQDGDGNDDFSCVNIHAPDFETLDISSAACGVVF